MPTRTRSSLETYQAKRDFTQTADIDTALDQLWDEPAYREVFG